MALKHAVAHRDVQPAGMTVDQFKEWLKRFDADGDGRISRQELRTAIRISGHRFSRWKCRRGMKGADADADGYIDSDEMENLVAFAKKSLGINIVVK